MPDVTGKTMDEALSILRGKGWSGTVDQKIDRNNNKFNDGEITKTNPSAGNQISKSQTITFFVAENGFPGIPTTTTSGMTDPERGPHGSPGGPRRNVQPLQFGVTK